MECSPLVTYQRCYRKLSCKSASIEAYFQAKGHSGVQLECPLNIEPPEDGCSGLESTGRVFPLQRWD